MQKFAEENRIEIDEQKKKVKRAYSNYIDFLRLSLTFPLFESPR
jgi:hypothetical protein